MNLNLDSCRHSNFYDVYTKRSEKLAVLILPGSLETYIKSTSLGKYYRRSIKRGYSSRLVSWTERNDLVDDIYCINISTNERQGKLMSQSYFTPVVKESNTDFCPNHTPFFIGCFKDKLYSYIVSYPMGEVCFLSSIIGHHDYLKDYIMLNNFFELVRFSIDKKYKCLVYGDWETGTDGLRSWKHSVGFKPDTL